MTNGEWIAPTLRELREGIALLDVLETRSPYGPLLNAREVLDCRCVLPIALGEPRFAVRVDGGLRDLRRELRAQPRSA